VGLWAGMEGGGNVYGGWGEGRLFVLTADGRLRWSMLLIDGPRDDLNASPALGLDSIVLAGESGEVFSIPYDWCLRPEAATDGRCRLRPGEDLPDDGAVLYWTTQFGRTLPPPPPPIEPNPPTTFSLVLREAGDTRRALLRTATARAHLDPPVPL